MAVSQNGWPADDPSLVASQPVPGTQTHLTVRKDAAGQLLLEVASAFNRLVQPIDGGVLDDWGYAERPIRGGTALSNHASGTAVDLNATQHPLGTQPSANFTSAQIDQIHRILAVTGGVVRFGGDYGDPGHGGVLGSRDDPMHFEINDGQTIGSCAQALAAMRQFNSGLVPAPAPVQGMDAATLAAVMGNVAGVPYAQYLGPFLDGMTAAQCTTVNRAAMWCAQLGEESGGLQWMEEIADGSAYEGRKDLGNTEPGDGKRFKGRGPIQLTGRANYTLFSEWAHSRGFVDQFDYFVQNPLLVAQPRWGLLAASWYWTVARVRLNAYADAGDMVSATRAINGGTNGLADRTARWNRALTFGARLLPGEPDMDARQDAMLTALYQQASGTDQVGQWVGWPSWSGGSGRSLTPVDYLRQVDVQVTGLRTELDALTQQVAALTAQLTPKS